MNIRLIMSTAMVTRVEREQQLLKEHGVPDTLADKIMTKLISGMRNDDENVLLMTDFDLVPEE